MTQGLFGSVTPGWTGIAPGPVWPAFGPSLSGLENAPPLTPSSLGFGNPGVPMMTGTITTPLVVPSGMPASTVIATMAMRRGQPQGPGSDQDVEELLYDTIELIPSAGEVEVRCENGRVSLTGSVPNKRLKRDIGELAWAIPAINDVNNTITIQTRRRSRGFGRESEQPPAGRPAEPRTKN